MLRIETICAQRNIIEHFQTPSEPIPVLKLDAATHGERDERRIVIQRYIVNKFVAREACANQTIGAAFGIATGIVHEVYIA